MIRQPRFARFVLPLLSGLCQPSFVVELRTAVEACRQEPLLEGSPMARGEAGHIAREGLSLAALQVQVRILATRLGRDGSSLVTRQPTTISDYHLFGNLGLTPSPPARHASIGESAAVDALRF